MPALSLCLVRRTQDFLRELHGSAVKTLSLLVWALALVKKPNLSQWARVLGLYRKRPDGSRQAYGFAYKKFRIWRFLSRSIFRPEELWEAITHRLLDPRDSLRRRHPIFILMDWTDLGDQMALVLALPYHGRALPLLVEIVEKIYLENSMTDLELECVRRFLGWLSPGLRSRIEFLADRGFAKIELFEAIEEAGATYAIRLPRHFQISLSQGWVALGDLGLGVLEEREYRDIECTQEHRHRLGIRMRRIMTGAAHDPDDDTWYIATNRSEISPVLGHYALRMKVEELFRDWKHLLDLDGHELAGEDALGRLVGVLGVYYVLVVLEGQAHTTPERLRQITRPGRRSPELSIFRQTQAVLERWSDEAGWISPDLLMPLWTQRR